MIRLSVVSYLNSKPFTEGLERFFAPDELEIRLLVPAVCAKEFQENRSQIALIPVGSLLDFSEIHILDDYCIGANGFVDSVYLFSQEPIENIDTVFLDWHSRSSNGLTKILLKHFWKREVQFVSQPDYFQEIHGKKAGVIIGDRAIEVRHSYRYAYDLAKVWKEFTGLPFTFALWVFHPTIVNTEMLQTCKDSFAWGMKHRQEIAQKWAAHFGMSPEAAFHYLTQSIDYQFDETKKQAVQQYLKYLGEIENRQVPAIHFSGNI